MTSSISHCKGSPPYIYWRMTVNTRSCNSNEFHEVMGIDCAFIVLIHGCFWLRRTFDTAFEWLLQSLANHMPCQKLTLTNMVIGIALLNTSLGDEKMDICQFLCCLRLFLYICHNIVTVICIIRLFVLTHTHTHKHIYIFIYYSMWYTNIRFITILSGETVFLIITVYKFKPPGPIGSYAWWKI